MTMPILQNPLAFDTWRLCIHCFRGSSSQTDDEIQATSERLAQDKDLDAWHSYLLLS